MKKNQNVNQEVRWPPRDSGSAAPHAAAGGADRTINGLPGARRQRLQQPVGLHPQQVRRGLQVLLRLRLHRMQRTPSLAAHHGRIPAAGQHPVRKARFASARDALAHHSTLSTLPSSGKTFNATDLDLPAADGALRIEQPPQLWCGASCHVSCATAAALLRGSFNIPQKEARLLTRP